MPFSNAECSSCTNEPVSGGTSPGSTGLPEVEVHSTELSGGVDSPEMETVTLGALRSSLPIADSVHQEFPIIMAVGGGHRKLLRKRHSGGKCSVNRMQEDDQQRC